MTTTTKKKLKFFCQKLQNSTRELYTGSYNSSLIWGGVFFKLLTLYSCGVLCVYTCLKAMSTCTLVVSLTTAFCRDWSSCLAWLTKLGLLYECLQNTLRFHTSASPSDFSPIRQLFLCISFSLAYCGRKCQPALHKPKHRSRTPVALRNAGVLPRSLERCFLSTWFLPKTAHQLWVNILLVPAYASISKQ